MSILWTLRKHVDAVTHREELAAAERDRTVAVKQNAGDGGAEQPTAQAPRFACRICAHTSDDPAYCPTCLADTMMPV